MSTVGILQLSEGSSEGAGGIVSVVNEIERLFEDSAGFSMDIYFHGDKYPDLLFGRRIANKISRSVAIKGQPYRHAFTSVPNPKIDLGQYNIVQLHKPTFFRFAAASVIKFPHVKFIVHAHSIDGFSGGCVLENECEQLSVGCAKCPVVKPLFQPVPPRAVRRRLSQFNTMKPWLIANSQYTLDCVMRSPVATAFRGSSVVTPGFDELQFCCTEGKVKNTEDEAVIGFAAASVGDTNKQFNHFVRLLRSLQKELRIPVRAAVAGHPPDDASQEGVTFAGPLETGKLAEFYRQIDLLVVCSRSESFGKVSVEAQACGTPVVAYSTGGIPETIIDGATGRLVNPGDEKQLLACAVELLCQRNRARDQLASPAARKFLRRFGRDSIREQYSKIYCELATT